MRLTPHAVVRCRVRGIDPDLVLRIAQMAEPGAVAWPTGPPSW